MGRSRHRRAGIRGPLVRDPGSALRAVIKEPAMDRAADPTKEVQANQQADREGQEEGFHAHVEATGASLLSWYMRGSTRTVCPT